MKKITTSVKVTELGDTAYRLVQLFKKAKHLKTDTFLSEIFKALEKLADELTDAIKKDLVFSQLKEADKKRDSAIRVLDRLLKGYEVIPIENLRNNAKKLIEIFKKYGVRITVENYTILSTLIASLLEDLSKDSLKPLIESLPGIKESIENIRTAQEDFQKIRSEYESNLASQKELKTASSLKMPIFDYINKKLIPYLVAMKISNPDEYKDFIAKASEIINSTNEGVNARKKKEKKA